MADSFAGRSLLLSRRRRNYEQNKFLTVDLRSWFNRLRQACIATGAGNGPGRRAVGPRRCAR